MLFDASDYIDPDSVTRSLNEIKSYNFQSPQQSQVQVPQKQTPPLNSQFQKVEEDGAGEGLGIISTIASLFL